MEDKQRICSLLLPVLQETRNLHDLVHLEYDDRTDLVHAIFADGGRKIANVTADSGTSMIRDIIKQIV